MDNRILQYALDELTGQYNVPRKLMVLAIQDTLQQVLSTRYPDDEVRVIIEEDFSSIQIFAISGAFRDYIREIPVSRLTGVKNLKKNIKRTLDFLEVTETIKSLKRFKHEIVKGTVIRKDTKGSLYVEFKPQDHRLPECLVGICPPGYLPVKERRNFNLGDIAYFHFRDCYASLTSGNIRLEIILDRITKNLPSLLMKHYLRQEYPSMAQNARITARYRRSGEISEIWTNTKIPVDIRNQVKKALPGEKLLIFVGDDRQAIEKSKGKVVSRKKARSNQKLNQPKSIG